MRVEEMYLTEAEARRRTTTRLPAKPLLQSFMVNRNPSLYGPAANDRSRRNHLPEADRVWGEGIIFYDLKRLNKSMHNGDNGNERTVERPVHHRWPRSPGGPVRDSADCRTAEYRAQRQEQPQSEPNGQVCQIKMQPFMKSLKYSFCDRRHRRRIFTACTTIDFTAGPDNDGAQVYFPRT